MSASSSTSSTWHRGARLARAGRHKLVLMLEHLQGWHKRGGTCSSFYTAARHMFASMCQTRDKDACQTAHKMLVSSRLEP
jgi:hypothetical protein